MVYSSPAAWLRLWLCACCCVLPLPTLAQEDPKNVYLWWDHKEHGHHDLIARLKKYSASLPQRQKPAASEEEEQQGGTEPNPLIEAFERTNTHAFVIQGPHPARASNVRNFSRALGFTESGGKHLTKIHTVLGHLSMAQRKELWANKTAKYHQGTKWVGRFMTVKAHMNALQTFLNTNYTNAVIFEDDVMKTGPFSWPELRTLMADMLTLDSQHWDLQYQGLCYSEPFNFHWKDNVLVKSVTNKNVYFRALNAFCLHAMVYNRVAAEVFLTKWMPFREAVDTLLSELVCEYGLKAIRPAVPIFHQDRTLTKSSARNRDPLFVFKFKRSYPQWAECYRRFNATKAAAFGLSQPAVPRIVPKIKNGHSYGYSLATDATPSP